MLSELDVMMKGGIAVRVGCSNNTEHCLTGEIAQWVKVFAKLRFIKNTLIVSLNNEIDSGECIVGQFSHCVSYQLIPTNMTAMAVDCTVLPGSLYMLSMLTKALPHSL